MEKWVIIWFLPFFLFWTSSANVQHFFLISRENEKIFNVTALRTGTGEMSKFPFPIREQSGIYPLHPLTLSLDTKLLILLGSMVLMVLSKPVFSSLLLWKVQAKEKVFWGGKKNNFHHHQHNDKNLDPANLIIRVLDSSTKIYKPLL